MATSLSNFQWAKTNISQRKPIAQQRQNLYYVTIMTPNMSRQQSNCNLFSLCIQRVIAGYFKELIYTLQLMKIYDFSLHSKNNWHYFEERAMEMKNI